MSRRRRRILMLAVGMIPTATSLHACAPAAVQAPPAPAAVAPANPSGEVVVLVHGMGRTPVSMLPLAWALEREGYRVVNWGYSSYSHSVPELGRRLAADLDERLEAGGHPAPRRVHFVGHSLGNIVVRWVLANDPPRGTGRVVMLAPPNQGSRSADRHARWLGWLLRPLPELRTGEHGIARTLPLPEGVAVGIIAGEHDGKVSLAETRLPGASAHVVVPSAHTFIMVRRDVARLTARFLREGRFAEGVEAQP